MKKFKDSLNTAVFTSKNIVENNSPILLVSYDSDGSWQFNGSETDFKQDNCCLVARYMRY